MLYRIVAFIFVYQSFKKCRISAITLGMLMFEYGFWVKHRSFYEKDHRLDNSP